MNESKRLKQAEKQIHSLLTRMAQTEIAIAAHLNPPLVPVDATTEVSPTPAALTPAKLWPGSQTFGDPAKVYIETGEYRLPVAGEAGRPETYNGVAIATGSCCAWNICIEVQPSYSYAGKTYVPAGWGDVQDAQFFVSSDGDVVRQGGDRGYIRELINMDINGGKRIILVEAPEPVRSWCPHNHYLPRVLASGLSGFHCSDCGDFFLREAPAWPEPVTDWQKACFDERVTSKELRAQLAEAMALLKDAMTHPLEYGNAGELLWRKEHTPCYEALLQRVGVQDA